MKESKENILNKSIRKVTWPNCCEDILEDFLYCFTIGQMLNLTEEQIEKSKRLIYDFLQEYKHTQYFMLLLKELSYYTLFVSNDDSNENMSDVIIECLSNLGSIIDINNESEGAIEVWIKDNNEEAHIGYFFPYD